jgi:hypothetical protein
VDVGGFADRAAAVVAVDFLRIYEFHISAFCKTSEIISTFDPRALDLVNIWDWVKDILITEEKKVNLLLATDSKENIAWHRAEEGAENMELG